MSIFDQNVKKLNVNKRNGKNNNRKKIIKLIKFPSRHALKKMLSKAFSCRLKVCLYIQTPDILLIT